jgi:predicted PurR-regulated permease PerM
MSTHPDGEQPRGAVVFFFLVLTAAMAAFVYTLWEFVADLVLGLLIAGMARPLYLRLLRDGKGRPTLAAAAVTTLVAVLIVFPLIWLVTSLSQQAASAYTLVQEMLAGEGVQQALRGENWIGRRARGVFEALGVDYTPESLRDLLAGAFGGIASFLTTQLNALVTNFVLAIYHFALILVVLFYGLIDGPAIKRRAFELSPLPDEEEELIVQKFKDVGIAILFGSGAASVLQGTLGGIAMWVAGIPSPLFWGVIVAIFAFLPLVGTNVVIVPATIYLFVVGRWPAAIGFFLFCNLQGLLIDNLMTPRLVGGRMRMHNLVIFLALIGGISTFGMGGLVYGPLLAALVLTLLDLYERVYRQRLFGVARRSLIPPASRV